MNVVKSIADRVNASRNSAELGEVTANLAQPEAVDATDPTRSVLHYGSSALAPDDIGVVSVAGDVPVDASGTDFIAKPMASSLDTPQFETPFEIMSNTGNIDPPRVQSFQDNVGEFTSVVLDSALVESQVLFATENQTLTGGWQPIGPQGTAPTTGSAHGQLAQSKTSVEQTPEGIGNVGISDPTTTDASAGETGQALSDEGDLGAASSDLNSEALPDTGNAAIDTSIAQPIPLPVDTPNLFHDQLDLGETGSATIPDFGGEQVGGNPDGVGFPGDSNQSVTQNIMATDQTDPAHGIIGENGGADSGDIDQAREEADGIGMETANAESPTAIEIDTNPGGDKTGTVPETLPGQQGPTGLNAEQGAVSSAPSSIQPNDAATMTPPEISLATGFRAEYFDRDHAIRNLNDIDWTSEATHTELINEIDYRNSSGSFWDGGSTNTFGAKITGNITVKEAGEYEFFLGGDDGAMLIIDGVPLIDNNGLHAFRTRNEEIELEAGPHAIEVRYFENYGHAGLKLEWQGPGTEGRELVTAPQLDDLQTVAGMPVSLAIETHSGPDTPATITQTLEGLPPGTTVLGNGPAEYVDDQGTIDISGWDTSLLSITPPPNFIGESTIKLVIVSEDQDGAQPETIQEFELTSVAPDLDPVSVQLQSGFTATYFDMDHGLKNLDQVDWAAEPTHQEIVQDIDYENGPGSFWDGGSKDTFAARITGQIIVDEAGEYEFILAGDDGATLFIDGQEVVDNDGLHGFRTRTGSFDLQPGSHKIEVRYFENYGHAGLKLEWQGPDTDGRELVAPAPDLTVVENGIGNFEIDTGTHEVSSVTITGLPMDTILISGDDTAVSDGGPLQLDGWDTGHIEMAAPPGFEGAIKGEIRVTSTAFNGQETEGRSEFSIEVGEVGYSDDSKSILELAEFPDGDAGHLDDTQGWSEEDHGSDDDDRDEDNRHDGDDDVLSEEIELGRIEDGPAELVESYERQDW